MAADALHKLRDLITAAKSGAISLEEFCSRYETVFNLELDKSSLPDSELRPLAALFEKVVWFSPYPDERKRIPRYLGESEIAAALNALSGFDDQNAK
jgi:hypothetical protein